MSSSSGALTFVARIKRIAQWRLLVRAPDIHPLHEVMPEDRMVDVDLVDVP